MVEARWDRTENRWAIIENNETVGYTTSDSLASDMSDYNKILNDVKSLVKCVYSLDNHTEDVAYFTSFVEAIKRISRSISKEDTEAKEELFNYILKNIDFLSTTSMEDLHSGIDDCCTIIENNEDLNRYRRY